MKALKLAVAAIGLGLLAGCGGDPDGVALETLWFEDLGDGRTRLRTQSLVDSFDSRDAWLRSGMEVGVNEGYAKLDRMLADGAI